MADIVNLKQFRKKRERDEREQEAGAKRILFGRTKGEKSRDEKTKSAEVKKLDGARRERDESKD
ncbi:MAG: hypothetical protein B7Y90_02105 [Alphaproteobacteria bacterium 32-64-14]|jgi:hypothetical protein|nr:MAG: hypothetical protein B7Y90_02105 [Alphaproteobacteria bacterium 32-64-14]